MQLHLTIKELQLKNQQHKRLIKAKEKKCEYLFFLNFSCPTDASQAGIFSFKKLKSSAIGFSFCSISTLSLLKKLK
jgi:hypothetical protein